MSIPDLIRDINKVAEVDKWSNNVINREDVLITWSDIQGLVNELAGMAGVEASAAPEPEPEPEPEPAVEPVDDEPVDDEPVDEISDPEPPVAGGWS
jgi:hypothetical protein